jgi:7-cyano-7-deazaguanine synthase
VEAFPIPDRPRQLAVLASGGLDSAILLGISLAEFEAVHPIYVRHGYTWEGAEQAHLRQFLAAVSAPALGPLQVLDVPVGDLLPEHWSTTGRGVPDARAPDEAVFLPARNALLLLKAMLWCHLHAVPVVALGILGSNPFPDATPRFFERFTEIVNAGIGSRVEVWRPFERMSKAEILQRGRGLPLEWTFSCLRPVAGRHCGACNKCAERRRAFEAAGLPDPTLYDRPS